MSDTPLSPEKQAMPLLPKDHNFEGGDSPASNMGNYPSKRRKLDAESIEDDVYQNDGFPIAPELKPSKWQGTINNVIKAIVSIRFSQVAAFDTEGNKEKNSLCSKLMRVV